MQQILTARQSLLEDRQGSASVWVLDTNVVLDLLVFRDPRCAALAAALRAAPGGWATTEAMRAEFNAVTARNELSRWTSRRSAAQVDWAELTTLVDAAPRCELRCADPDDQIFLDLAAALRPCWLLSRDAKVLLLRRRAAPLGIRIATPSAWEAETKQGDPIDRPAS